MLDVAHMLHCTVSECAPDASEAAAAATSSEQPRGRPGGSESDSGTGASSARVAPQLVRFIIPELILSSLMKELSAHMAWAPQCQSLGTALKADTAYGEVVEHVAIALLRSRAQLRITL